MPGVVSVFAAGGPRSYERPSADSFHRGRSRKFNQPLRLRATASLGLVAALQTGGAALRHCVAAGLRFGAASLGLVAAYGFCVGRAARAVGHATSQLRKTTIVSLLTGGHQAA